MSLYYFRATIRLAARRSFSWLGSSDLGWAHLAYAGSGPTLQIEVDARDLPRRLLHSRIQVPCQPGKLEALVSEVGAGHSCAVRAGPGRGGPAPRDPRRQAVPWRRDETEPYRVECEVPDGVREIIVRLDTICNEPAVEAAGYLSYGNNSVGIINWSTCLLYPEGPSCDDIQAHLSLRLPLGLAVRDRPQEPRRIQADGQLATFKTVSLTDLVDNPLIAGEHLRTIPLDTGD